MKKISLILTILLVTVMIFCVTGCKDPEPAHEHTFSDSWSKDGTYHWHAATCEHTTEVSGKAAHSFDDWTVTKAATEEAEGTKERSCTVCGYTATEAIEKLAHTHKFADHPGSLIRYLGYSCYSDFEDRVGLFVRALNTRHNRKIIEEKY